jgi:tRNA modification GTPase
MDPASGEPIDQGLVLWFPGPGSFTGEDLAELHLHGGRAVREAALEALATLPGLRPAEPGEFTRRAFDAGKLDLAEVEGLADLINAETEAQRRQALRQMQGALSRQVEDWRRRLVGAAAHVEAGIDFPDEELPEGIGEGARREIAQVAAEIADSLNDGRRGERLREGFRVAIVGPPNVGKSSILNILARRNAAIVSDTAGTTRDVVEVHLDLRGLPVSLADTAGIRALEEEERELASGHVELEGMRRSRTTAASADLLLLVLEATLAAKQMAEMWDLFDSRTILVLNKSDLLDGGRQHAGHLAKELQRGLAAAGPATALSARSGEGIEALLQLLMAEAEARVGRGAEGVITRLRHRRALEDCSEALRRSLAAEAAELAAEDLRLALRALARVAGRVDVQDLLDVIFADFCIGK